MPTEGFFLFRSDGGRFKNLLCRKNGPSPPWMESVMEVKIDISIYPEMEVERYNV